MANFQLQAVRSGFLEPTGPHAQEVLMATYKYENEKMAITSDPKVLWTQGMSDCRSVATYTPSTGVRSLTHLQGGGAGAAFYKALVPILTEDSCIIFIAGAYDKDEDDFTTRTFDTFVGHTDDGLCLAGMAKRPPPGNYVAYWSDEGWPMGATGFVFKSDGRYGILNVRNGAP